MNGKMPVYYKCNMSKMEYIAVYIGKPFAFRGGIFVLSLDSGFCCDWFSRRNLSGKNVCRQYDREKTEVTPTAV